MERVAKEKVTIWFVLLLSLYVQVNTNDLNLWIKACTVVESYTKRHI